MEDATSKLLLPFDVNINPPIIEQDRLEDHAAPRILSRVEEGNAQLYRLNTVKC